MMSTLTTVLVLVAIAAAAGALILDIVFWEEGWGMLLGLITVVCFVAAVVSDESSRPDPPTPAAVCRSHGGVRSFNDDLAVCLDGHSARAEL